MGVTGGGLDLKDTLLDSQERYIESSSTQIENAGNLQPNSRPQALEH
jgi:hypothetical protein